MLEIRAWHYRVENMLEIKLRNIAADKIITATTQFETLESYVNEM